MHTLCVTEAGNMQAKVEKQWCKGKVSGSWARTGDWFSVLPLTSYVALGKALYLSGCSFLTSKDKMRVPTSQDYWEKANRYWKPLPQLLALKKNQRNKFLFFPGKGSLQNWPEASSLLNVNTFLYLFTVYNFQRQGLWRSWFLFESAFEDEKVSNPPETWLVEVKTNVYFNLASYNLFKAFGKCKYYLCSHKGTKNFE